LNSVRQSIWLTLASSYFGLALQLISTMILARILTPEQVGVFAIAAVFSSLASMFRDFGVAEYLIQMREFDRQKVAAALAMNIIVSWAMAAAMFLGASAVANFYGYPVISDVMRIQSIGFLLVPFGAVTMAWFRRELNFRPVIISNVAGSLTGFVVSIALAWRGFGALSLAWSAVAAIAVTVAFSLWYRPKEFPRLPTLRGLGEVFHFSKFVSLMYIVSQVAKSLPDLVVGRVLGAVDVAMLSRGNGLVEMFGRLVMRAVYSVCMPYLAKSDRESGTIAPAYVNSVSYLTVVGWPMLAFMALAAFPAIRIMYGPQWDAAVPVAQVLCLACAIDLVHSMSREALLTRGLAKEANSLQFLLLLLGALSLSLIVPYGLIGAAWGATAACAAGVMLSQRYLALHLGVRARAVARGCLPSAVLTAVTIAPAALWALVVGVNERNYITFAVVGAVLTAASWIAAVQWLRHPIVAEFEPIKRRLAGLIGFGGTRVP
jgi:O-antigen/teichoic acid export membrane protein